jgi:hypothetical protein
VKFDGAMAPDTLSVARTVDWGGTKGKFLALVETYNVWADFPFAYMVSENTQELARFLLLPEQYKVSYEVHMNWLRSILRLSTAKMENRYCDRFLTMGKIRISWQDRRGKTKLQTGRVVNMSDTGALVKCGASIAPGSLIYIQSPELRIMGSAHVRHCEPLLVRYEIGLQFAGPLG